MGLAEAKDRARTAVSNTNVKYGEVSAIGCEDRGKASHVGGCPRVNYPRSSRGVEIDGVPGEEPLPPADDTRLLVSAAKLADGAGVEPSEDARDA